MMMAMLTPQAMGQSGLWNHMGWAGAWFMWIFWLALLLLVILAIRWMTTSGSGERRGRSEDAESILKRRYASGEIDDQSFQRMREELRR